MMVSQFMTKKLIFEVLAMDSIVFWNVTKWTVSNSRRLYPWLKGYPWKIFCRKFTLIHTQHTHKTEVSNKPNKYSHPTKLDKQNYKLNGMSQECSKTSLILHVGLQLLRATFYKITTFDNLPKLVSWLLLCSPEGPGNNPGISTTEIMNYDTLHQYMNIILYWVIYFNLQIHLKMN
jgi:hypothetical protein